MTDVLFLSVLLGVLGLVVGSFLNVVVWRVPRGESVVHPRSSCPRCGTEIRARDNVPVLSWLLLRGRCRSCGEPISVRYPLVEAGTAGLFILVGLRFGVSWELPAYLYLAAIAIALALIDLDVHKLPNAIVLPAYPVTAVLLGGAALGTGEWDSLVRAVLAGVVLFGAYFLMALAYPTGMGWGDVKLAGVLGAYLGWISWGVLAVGAFSAFLLGGLYALALVALRRAGRKSGIPFGPWMLLGAAVGIGWGEQIWQGYLSAVGL